ncbi:hypothetical protein QPK87_09675 [Kamptonema cortianum]|nr:hypothetical protein [Kamptonema cortianum]
MSDERLYRLYKLHVIDKKLFEIKSRAGALDVGKRELVAAQKLESETAEIRQKFEDLAAKAKEIENREVTSEEKLNKFQKQLYDGSLTNPREIENVQKEIEMLEELVVKLDDDRKAILAERESIRAEAEAATRKIQALKDQATAKRKQAQAEHERLQEAFKATGIERPPVLKEVEPNLLREYDAVRKKNRGYRYGSRH